MNELVTRQVSTDNQLLDMWLATRESPATRRAYARYGSEFISQMPPVPQVMLRDLVVYFSQYKDQPPATQAARVRAVRSLFSFAQKLNYIKANVASLIKPPKTPRKVATRILSEGEVQRILVLETNLRNRALLAVLYYGGLRAAEASRLTLGDLMPRGEGRFQLSVHGKGDKVRVVLLSRNDALAEWVAQGAENDLSPLFPSRVHPQLGITTRQIRNIVRKAARTAGIEKAVSPHWFRHAHASHSHKRGCPIAIVQVTLGHADLTTTTQYIDHMPDESSALYLE